MQKRRLRFLFGGVLLLVFAVLVVGVWLIRSQMSKKTPVPAPQSHKNVSASQVKAPVGRVRVVAMGDMLAHDSVVAQARTATGYDFAPYFAHVRPLYKDADVVFCNPETLSAGPAYGISGYPAFNAPTEFARDLVQGAGCNVVNLATNHINDKGQTALDATVTVWEGLKPLAYSGANRSAVEQMQTRVFTRNGLKIGFVAFADYSNNKAVSAYGLNSYHDAALVKKLVGEARAQADAVIVSAHWGTEDSTTVNADQQAAAQLFADSGADVVIGTGPHVLQKVSSLTAADGRKTLVWYSIGNMLSSQLKVEELTGVIAGFTMQKRAGGGGVDVTQPTAHATYMSYDWSPADRAAQTLATRSNLTLKPLTLDDPRPAQMFGASYNGSERAQFVRTTLGNELPLKLLP